MEFFRPASTGVNTISQNTIHSLTNNSGAASNSIYALYCSFATGPANIVERNFVHSLSITSTAPTSQLVGILPVAGSGTYKNNMVQLGLDANGNSITPGYVIYGMFEIAGTNNLYFNSVYIGGSGVVFLEQHICFSQQRDHRARAFTRITFSGTRAATPRARATNYAISLSRAERSYQQLQRPVCQWRWRLCGGQARAGCDPGGLADLQWSGCQQHLG